VYSIKIKDKIEKIKIILNFKLEISDQLPIINE